MEDAAMVSCGISMIDVFDENLLTEIFIRLPLKTKFQCKAVCKPWLRLISSPYFAQRVLSIKQDIPPWVLLCQYDLKDLEVAIRTFQLESLVETIWPRPEICATHNGLLLCYHEGKLHVRNPQTCEEVSLPLPPRVDDLSFKGFIVSCDNGSTIFKVVWGSRFHSDECDNIFVFSSEVGEWLDTGVAWPRTQGYSRKEGVFHDGKLHWIVNSESSSSLMTFDPDKNECRVFSFNAPLNSLFKSEGLMLANWCGRLCYASYACRGEDVLSVFVLDSYETGEWRPLFRTQLRSVLDANEIQGDYFPTYPLFFHPFDMDTVYFENPRSLLVALNLRTLKFSSVNIDPQIDSTVAVWEMLPFVVPPWPTSVPRQFWEAENFSA